MCRAEISKEKGVLQLERVVHPVVAGIKKDFVGNVVELT
jgi:hypothetical protein